MTATASFHNALQQAEGAIASLSGIAKSAFRQIGQVFDEKTPEFMSAQELMDLADSYESNQPSLASELRAAALAVDPEISSSM